MNYLTTPSFLAGLSGSASITRSVDLIKYGTLSPVVVLLPAPVMRNQMARVLAIFSLEFWLS